MGQYVPLSPALMPLLSGVGMLCRAPAPIWLTGTSQGEDEGILWYGPKKKPGEVVVSTGLGLLRPN